MRRSSGFPLNCLTSDQEIVTGVKVFLCPPRSNGAADAPHRNGSPGSARRFPALPRGQLGQHLAEAIPQRVVRSERRLGVNNPDSPKNAHREPRDECGAFQVPTN